MTLVKIPYLLEPEYILQSITSNNIWLPTWKDYCENECTDNAHAIAL